LRSTFNNWYENKVRSNPELSEETDQIENILKDIKTIAIVGISRNRHRDSHYVGRYLQNAGYKIFPVNPGAETILGVKAYDNLASIPEKIDAVDVFVNPKYVPQIVDQAIDIKPKAIWLQLGAGTHPAEVEKAKNAGVILVQNRCIKVDHQFLIRDKGQGAPTCEINFSKKYEPSTNQTI
jgi:predicted CoA-binding protein